MPIKLIQSLDGHTDRIWTLAWNPQGTVLASSGRDCTIRMWAKENDNWVCIAKLTEAHSKSIRRISWSPCGYYLASASFDSTICIWRKSPDDSSWTTAVNMEGHESEVKSVAWSHDGQYLASCGRDRTVWIWERAPADEAGDSDDQSNAENWDCSDVKNDHSKDVKQIVWHPTCNILVSCSYDDTIKLFHRDGDDWKCFETLSSHTSTVWSASFSSTGEFLASCSDDKTVRVWKNQAHEKLPDVEPNSWKCVSVVQGYHGRSIYDISWCKLNNTIVSASGDNSLAFYARSTDDSLNQDLFVCVDKQSNSHDCDVNSVSWNPKVPGLLASGSDDRKIKLWSYTPEIKGRKPLTFVEEVMKNLAAFKPDSKLLQFETNATEFNLNVTDHSTLMNLTQSLQQLQNDILCDEERSTFEKLLDLKFTGFNSSPVELADLKMNEDLSVKQFTIDIKDKLGKIVYKFIVMIETSKFRLMLPKRSTKLITVASELFLLEKTGDLYRILSSGQPEFLLGHLFMFSDIRFILKTSLNGCSEISYIISADRDEKIRVSKFPNTYDILTYCFGHKEFVRRLFVVDESRFVSLDQGDTICLWDLSKIVDQDQVKQFNPEGSWSYK